MVRDACSFCLISLDFLQLILTHWSMQEVMPYYWDVPTASRWDSSADICCFIKGLRDRAKVFNSTTLPIIVRFLVFHTSSEACILFTICIQFFFPQHCSLLGPLRCLNSLQPLSHPLKKYQHKAYSCF